MYHCCHKSGTDEEAGIDEPPRKSKKKAAAKPAPAAPAPAPQPQSRGYAFDAPEEPASRTRPLPPAD